MDEKKVVIPWVLTVALLVICVVMAAKLSGDVTGGELWTLTVAIGSLIVSGVAVVTSFRSKPISVGVALGGVETKLDELKITVKEEIDKERGKLSVLVQQGATLIQRDRERCAFRFLELLNSEDHAEVRLFIRDQVSGEDMAGKGIVERIKADKDLRRSVCRVLGFYEDVSLAVQSGHVDELVLYKSINWLVADTYERLKPYIEDARKVLDKSLYTELENLYLRWKQVHEPWKDKWKRWPREPACRDPGVEDSPQPQAAE